MRGLRGQREVEWQSYGAVVKQHNLSQRFVTFLGELYTLFDAVGAQRGQAFATLPKWTRQARRPSCLDLVTLLWREMPEHPEIVASLGLNPG